MALLKNGQLTEDLFTPVPDDDVLPAGEPVLVSLTRWLRDRAVLSARNSPVGVVLKSSEAPAALADSLDSLALIAIEFPAFRDGRGFTSAYRLRTQLGFTGELRAFGHVLPDQAQFLARCGFDSIVIKDDARLSDWQRGLSEMTVWYQPAADDRLNALILRHRANAG